MTIKEVTSKNYLHTKMALIFIKLDTKKVGDHLPLPLALKLSSNTSVVANKLYVKVVFSKALSINISGVNSYLK